MIRGKKNFIHPQPLQMAFGLMFVIDADSIKRRRLVEEQKAKVRFDLIFDFFSSFCEKIGTKKRNENKSVNEVNENGRK